jgi:hypothetical protein
MEELMNVTNAHCHNISFEASRIRKYAYAFSTVGNLDMSEKLLSVAEQLEIDQRAIQDAVGKELDRQYKQSVQSSANVFNAALAGIKVARGVDDLDKTAEGLADAER